MKNLLIAILAATFLMACNASEDHAHHHPTTIGDHERCHMCGMMVTKYPGPKGQIKLKNTDHNPKFCSTRDMFIFALQPENQRQISQLYVHDIAVTDWEAPNDADFIEAKSAWYVHGTSRKAVMGSAVAPFSTEEAATDFAKEYGGAVFTYDQITLSLLDAH